MTNHSSTRFISRLTRDTLALVLAGGRGSRLKNLTKWRAKPAVPFGGKFRIIDFPLSNCINSGVRRIGILTQYKSHSLIRHVQSGWGFLRGEFGEFIELFPASQRITTEWYAGTADAIFQNLDLIRSHGPKYILVLAGDHVYKMDYGPMIARHVEAGADATVGCVEVPVADASHFGVMTMNHEGRVVRFSEKPDEPESIPGRPDTALASMGIYVFNADFLYAQLMRDANTTSSGHDFGHDVVPAMVEKHRIMTYPFRDVRAGGQSYWRDVGTVDAFWEANMALMGEPPGLNLYDDEWPIWTYQEQLPPANFLSGASGEVATVADSIVANGCIISDGLLKRSLLFSAVTVGAGSVLEESVLFPQVTVGANCRIRKAIVERGCNVPPNTVIGEDAEDDARRFYRTEGGVVVVTPELLGQPRVY